MDYTSVEAIFNEAVAEDIEDEAMDASEYGDIIDIYVSENNNNYSDINGVLGTVTDGVSPTMLNILIGDDEVQEKIDRQDTECDEYPDFDEEDYYDEEEYEDE